MTADPATPASRSRWRRLRIGRWLLVVILIACAYGAWREYDFRAAIAEAKALGWYWEYDDPFDAIKKDWKAAFRRETWDAGRRNLQLKNAEDLARHHRLAERLAPRSLWIADVSGARNLDALKGLSTLQDLQLWECASLTNADALSHLPELRFLAFNIRCGLPNLDGFKGCAQLQGVCLLGCGNLTNVDGLSGLPALRGLNLSGCTALSNVDGLRGLPALEVLDLGGCTGLSNINGLKGLSMLQTLWLTECAGLTNVDALKGLPKLQMVDLKGCSGLPREAIAALKSTLPNDAIIQQ